MRVYTFGDKRKKSIMLIPEGHWEKTFQEVIPMLQSDYYVHVVSLTGFDQKDRSAFKSMTDEIIKIEEYIRKTLKGKIYMIYGSSSSGKIVAKLIERNNIHMNHGILGSTKIKYNPVILAKIKAKIFTWKMYQVIKKGRYPKWTRKRREKKETTYQKKYERRYNIGSGGLPYIKKKTLYHRYYSFLATKIKKQTIESDTKIQIFFPKKTKKKYLRKLEKIFMNPNIIISKEEKEELLFCFPKEWVAEIKKIDQ